MKLFVSHFRRFLLFRIGLALGLVCLASGVLSAPKSKSVAKRECTKKACSKGFYYSTRYKKCYRYSGKAIFRQASCPKSWKLDKEKGICIRASCYKNYKKQKQSAKSVSNNTGLPNLKVIDWRGISKNGSCQPDSILGYVEITVKNTGQGTAGAGWSVQFYNQDVANWYTEAVVNKELKPGQTVTITSEIRIKNLKFVKSVPTIIFYPKLDISNKVLESDELDNISGDPLSLYKPKSCG